jgi:hypothetical protein
MLYSRIVDESDTQIGTLFYEVYPHGSFPKEKRNRAEEIVIEHLIEWEGERHYPQEVASIESSSDDHLEIGQRVNGTWISAGMLERSAKGVTAYEIHWGKAFSYLPSCRILLPQERSTWQYEQEHKS